jgi:Uma2 family endonuclease
VSTARQLHYSYEDYLAALSLGDLRLEYLAGEIFAMAGGSPLHGMIAARVIQVLGAPARCKVLTSDVKISIEATGLTTFPDVSVVCGDVAVAANDRNAVTNPTLLVEVASPSTEDYDSGEKLRHYQAIPSLEAVLLVAQDERRVTVVRRTPGGWERSEHADTFAIEQTGEIEVASLYP